MIRYSISEAGLRRKIAEEDPNWLRDAATRTAAFRAAGKYDEKLKIQSGNREINASPIWSRIKPVYMRIQHEKCAYCERQLSSEEWGRGEHDLEHYRPKSKARAWVLSAALRREGVTLTPVLQGRQDPGYHLLAYHPLNYCASCKTCNSGLKSDIFPIAGVRTPSGDNPRRLGDEQALLIYPMGSIDADPETLIDFEGVSPRAVPTQGFARSRALATISFFQLKNPARKELYRERARQIVAVYGFLLHRTTAGDVWDQLIEQYRAPHAPHTSCTRSFIRLFETNRQEADEFFQLARGYLNSVSQ